MNNFRGIQLAIELAIKQRDTFQRRVAVLERNVVAAKAQFGQLQSYAVDKDSGWMHAQSDGFSAEIVRHHYQFVSRLQQAIGMQAEVVTHALAQVEVAKKSLAAAEIRLEGLRQVLNRRLNVKAMLVTRRDQKTTDDFASQSYARRLANSEQGDGR